ncbi:TetR/AcrR family transcriptional regulator [Amycolatopsis alkalitolerans]|uniref:TetR/AcrR family transcriptional regulator n=1 Tax=Amycolatopsis alkalitolerans TaxID=2547244 RepID=A0A5C4M714_9PSEU|nr:TetR/AcrR family transcriptional regulator [Amycolatopsis alkalitolerans]TNC27758.1 TetR/AcrR family transcriptional regulator [Amycolatopsis alkalitolerans]
MGRWEPNARDRLLRAALELFVDRGYENVTVAEIAARAGLTKRTFFRHVTDKREVLFGGQEDLLRTFTDAIAAAPDSATPIAAIAAGVEAAGAVFRLDRRELVLQRQAVIASNDDLRERETLKSATLTATIAGALRERGVTEPVAGLAAEFGNLAFRTTFARWVSPGNQREFTELARETVGELRAATAALG